MTKDEFIEACNERMADPRFRTRVVCKRNLWRDMKAIRKWLRAKAKKRARDAKPAL